MTSEKFEKYSLVYSLSYKKNDEKKIFRKSTQVAVSLLKIYISLKSITCLYITKIGTYICFSKNQAFPSLLNKQITVFVWWIIKLVLSMKIDCLCLMILPPFSSQVKEPSSSIVISEIEKKIIYHWFLFINLNNQNVTIFSFYFYFYFLHKLPY